MRKEDESEGSRGKQSHWETGEGKLRGGRGRGEGRQSGEGRGEGRKDGEGTGGETVGGWEGVKGDGKRREVVRRDRGVEEETGNGRDGVRGERMEKGRDK